jgi:hypothetical protein
MLSAPNPPKGIFSAVARGNIKFDVVKSGLQKGIRRNIPDLAVPLALRGLEIGFMHKSVMSNLLNRMIVICGEDIGPACLPAISRVDQMITQLRTKKLETEADRKDMEMMLGLLVSYMCSQKKTRVLSFLKSYYGVALQSHPDLVDADIVAVFRQIDGCGGNNLQKWERALESSYPYISVYYALRMLSDKDTKITGVNMMPLLGRKTNKANTVHACWLKIFEKVTDKETCKILFKWFHGESEEHIYLMYAHVLLMEFDKCGTEMVGFETSMEKWHRMAYEDNIDIPDFVVDRHTKQGRTKGADKLSFALEGSKVEREYFGFLRLEEMRRVYVEIKKREDEDAEQQEKALVKPKGKKTEEISIDRLRSVIPVGEWTEEHEKAIALDSTYVGQVVCAKWKPQTYMIREGPLKGKIVKGPFALKEKMITLAGRVQGFKLMGCRTPDMIFMLDDQSRVWVQMTAFANRPVEEWQFELQMDNIVGKMVKTVRRSSLGSRQMMDKPMEEIREFMFGDYFLYGDYIIAAVFGCGDMGVWNCLAGDTEALIIDFDDSTTRTKIENAWDIFAKCPYKKHQEMFDMGMKTTIDRIRTVIASLQENRQKLLEIGAWREDYFEMVKKFYC